MITIITTTYNRGELLKKLYTSLCRQSDFDFEWIIIDDGSIDYTQDICKNFSCTKFPIKYFKKKNEGKCIAINYAVKLAVGEYCIIVDSDDWLTDNAIETIKKYLYLFSKYNICGISFFRQFSDGTLNGKFYKDEIIISNYIDQRLNSKDRLNDKAEVFSTKILKQYQFPKYENENFLCENICWIPMAYNYSMAFINKVIYVGDYLPLGLTRTVKYKKIENPIGSMNIGKLYMGKKMNLKNKIKGVLWYVGYGKIANYSFSYLMKNIKNKLLFLFFYLPGLSYYFYLKKGFKRYVKNKN